jgi:hypothetical protein
MDTELIALIKQQARSAPIQDPHKRVKWRIAGKTTTPPKSHFVRAGKLAGNGKEATIYKERERVLSVAIILFLMRWEPEKE